MSLTGLISCREENSKRSTWWELASRACSYFACRCGHNKKYGSKNYSRYGLYVLSGIEKSFGLRFGRFVKCEPSRESAFFGTLCNV